MNGSTPLRRAAIALALIVIPLTRYAAAAPGVLDSRIALVEASLIAETDSVAPGQPFYVAVRLRMKDTWHVNWHNPGDAGLAPGIEWRLPPGFSAGILEWPHPQRYPVGPLVIFGYDDEVLLLSRITPPADLPRGSQVELAASTSWLACQESCVPGEAEVRLQLPVGRRAVASANAEAFSRARLSLPTTDAAWEFAASATDDFILLRITPASPGLAPLHSVYFFPQTPGIVENAALQKLTTPDIESGYELRLERDRMERIIPDRLSGIIVSETGWGREDNAQALRVDVSIERR